MKTIGGNALFWERHKAELSTPDHVSEPVETEIHNQEKLVPVQESPIESTLYWRAHSEVEFFDRITGSLLTREETGMPYHSDSHSVRNFRMVCKIVNPKTVLEIGFNLGHSAVIWLTLGVKTLVSVDISRNPHVLKSTEIVGRLFGERFKFIDRNDPEFGNVVRGFQLDLVYIDGGHTYNDVMLDAVLAQSLGIKYLFFDDWFPRFGPGVQPVIRDMKLIPIALFGNMALCVWNTERNPVP